MIIKEPITLPCGVTLPNRLAKSAMSENMANKDHLPGPEFETLYNRWGKGETGLCISGNVMIDSRHLGEPNNVILEEGIKNFEGFKRWASVQEKYNIHIWPQLNHPGKQTPNFLTKEPVAPSAIPLKTALGNKYFNTPRELTNEEIEDIIKRFAYAAKMIKKFGFKGVQIHGAHGYLVSEFLSARHNQRTDKWGGTPEKRMLFVQEVYKAMRAAVGPNFPIGIKINTADFSKGGFTHEESIRVAKKLSDIGIDLIEISGGSYEQWAMTGKKTKDSTKKREAYFIEFAHDIKKEISCPLMVTGGFRTGEFINKSIASGEIDIAGLARPLCINPDFSKDLMEGKNIKSQVRPLSSGIKLLDKIFPLEIIWYTRQIQRMGRGNEPKPNAGVYGTIFKSVLDNGIEIIKRVRG